jgi:hypothetical protein
MWDQILISSAVISAIATTFVALASSAFYAVYVREKARSRYDEERHRAIISEIRQSYEAQLRNLTAQLMATEGRWKELNHLLISSQKTLSQTASDVSVDANKFLRAMGIDRSGLRIDPKLVLVLIPFNPEYDKVYEIIKLVCARAGLNCVRGDEEHSRGDILGHIIKLMTKARVVLAEITERNPNVYYELGIAHAFGKSTILISRSLEDVPFDVQRLRILIYKDLADLRPLLSESLLHAVADAHIEDSSDAPDLNPKFLR